MARRSSIGLAACSLFVGAFAALLFVSSASAAAQNEWVATCPVPPSTVPVGEVFSLEVDIQPAGVAPTLSYSWELENIAAVPTNQNTGDVAYSEASDGQAQRVTVFVSDPNRTERLSCRGVVAVESGDVIVPAGDGLLQAALDAANADPNFGEGDTIFLDRGDHTGNLDVVPYTGQTIRGLLGTNGTTLLSTLDGTGLNVDGGRSHAITTNPYGRQATDVTIDQLEITGYTTFGDRQSSGFFGAIHVQTALTGGLDPDVECRSQGRMPGYGPAANWKISNVWVHDNFGAGVLLASDTVLRDSTISDNYHLGIGGSLGENIVIDNVIVDNNSRFDEVQIGWHSGGLKMTRQKNLQILNSRFSNNRGPGIWLDIDVHSSQVRNNILSGNRKGLTNANSDNYGYGAFLEISFSSLIADNTISGNETGAMLIANVSGYERTDGVTVLNVVENNLVDDPTSPDERNGDRTCSWASERWPDPDKTRLPHPSPTGYVQDPASNFFANNDAQQIGALLMLDENSQPVLDADGFPIIDPVDQQPYVPRTQGQPLFTIGDVDCDNALTLLDALMIAQFDSGQLVDQGPCPLVQPGSLHAAAGDVDGNGTIATDDVLAALHCFVDDTQLCQQ